MLEARLDWDFCNDVKILGIVANTVFLATAFVPLVKSYKISKNCSFEDTPLPDNQRSFFREKSSFLD